MTNIRNDKEDAQANLLSDKLKIQLHMLASENQTLSNLIGDKEAELMDLRQELRRFQENLDEKTLMTENYQSGCKSAADHIAKLLRASKEQEGLMASFSEEIRQLKKELISSNNINEELKESNSRRLTQATEELEMYKSSLQKLDELFKKTIPSEETKLRLG